MAGAAAWTLARPALTLTLSPAPLSQAGPGRDQREIESLVSVFSAGA